MGGCRHTGYRRTNLWSPRRRSCAVCVCEVSYARTNNERPTATPQARRTQRIPIDNARYSGAHAYTFRYLCFTVDRCVPHDGAPLHKTSHAAGKAQGASPEFLPSRATPSGARTELLRRRTRVFFSLSMIRVPRGYREAGTEGRMGKTIASATTPQGMHLRWRLRRVSSSKKRSSS